MKKLSLVLITLFLFSGCATWKGIKKDTSDAWDYTKETVSDAFSSEK